MSADTTRRDVLKRVGIASSATATLASAAGTASAKASSRKARSVPRRERRRRMGFIPVKGRAVRKRWIGWKPATIGDGSYAYCGSINRDDLCHWHGSGCLYAAVGGSVAGLKFGWTGGLVAAGAGTLFCGLGKVGCRVFDDVEKGYDIDTEWLDCYMSTLPWWYRINVRGIPTWVVVVAVKEE